MRLRLMIVLAFVIGLIAAIGPTAAAACQGSSSCGG